MPSQGISNFIVVLQAILDQSAGPPNIFIDINYWDYKKKKKKKSMAATEHNVNCFVDYLYCNKSLSVDISTWISQNIRRKITRMIFPFNLYFLNTSASIYLSKQCWWSQSFKDILKQGNSCYCGNSGEAQSFKLLWANRSILWNSRQK